MNFNNTPYDLPIIPFSSNPTKEDSDEDGLSDGDEVNKYNSKPLLPDSDDDGIFDNEELILGTSPNMASSNRRQR